MRVTKLAAALLLLAACGDDSLTGGGAPTGAGGSGGSGLTGAGGAGGAMGLVCEGSLVSKGPWTLAATGTSVHIRWEACAEGSDPTVVVTPEAGGDEATFNATIEIFELAETHVAAFSDLAEPDWAGTYYMHDAEVTDLEPGTCYRYELAADPGRGGRFCTSRPSGEPFTFLAIADTNPALGSTDDTLSQVLPSNPDFTIHGGDIQYYDSFLETWTYWFPIMQPMLSQGAFYPAIGNHESEVAEELDEYALRFFGDAGFDGDRTYYRFESGGVWFHTVNTEEPISQGMPQAIWLEQQLANAAAQPGFRFSVVYMHRPLVTCGDSGDDEAARAHLEPIFIANRVLFVVQGHMHGYERFQFDSGPTYITTGGGGGLIGDVDENLTRSYCKSRAAAEDAYHAVLFDVGATEVAGRAIDRDGTVIDTFTATTP